MNEPDLKIENNKIQEYKYIYSIYIYSIYTECNFGDHIHGDSFIESYKNLARTTSEALGNI